jgi:cyclopropane fatty-acyl-phospholipid synthase-like methyltransferase/methyltransferase-like protein
VKITPQFGPTVPLEPLGNRQPRPGALSIRFVASAYEQVPYPAGVFPQTHPDRLATIGLLRGMASGPVDRCRVLELGCGAGNNLITMASNLPESEFFGIDLAKNAIASAREMVAGLGLQNVTVQHLDVCDVYKEKLGRFDFIIAHGLYSWVPAPVRQQILTICREMLHPHGVAYISYNAQPGNHLHDLSRGIIRFHTAHFSDPAEKIKQARGLLKFLGDSRLEPNAYTTALRTEAERVAKYTDEVFFHDDLSEVNRSFYFHEFMADARQHRMQFLGEAGPNELGSRDFNPEAIARMKELDGSPEIVREQYKDFFLGRMFRETLLCREELPLAPEFRPERVAVLYLSCDAELVNETEKGALFRRHERSEMTTGHPVVTSAVKYLCSRWPQRLPFEALLEHSVTAIGGTVPDGISLMLAETLLTAYRAGFIGLHMGPARLVTEISDRPTSSQLARFQLQRGDSTADQLHRPVVFSDPLSRRMVLVLDGNNDLDAIVRDLAEFTNESVETAKGKVEKGLQALARGGMLVG